MTQPVVSPGIVADALAALATPGEARDFMAALSLPVGEGLSARQFARLWMALADHLDDEFFGLGKRPMRRGSFRLMCHAALTAPTAGIALRRIIDFLRIAFDAPGGRLVLRDRIAFLEIEEICDQRASFACRTYFLLVLGVLCWLTNAHIPIIRIQLSTSLPLDRPEYLDFFGTQVLFGAEKTFLAFDGKWLSCPIRRSPAHLRRFLKAAPANILTRYRQDGGVARKLEQLFRTLPCTEWPSQSQAAALLAMSEASLRRRLKQEGTSFAALKNAALRRVAETMLLEAQLSITEIAISLGYSEPSAFYRAFRDWHGCSPGAYRTRALSGQNQ